MLVIGGLAIIITLFTENSSSLFDRELSIDKFSDLSILTRYRKITKKLDEISQIVSYKYDIYRKILIVLIISSVLVIGITILFLNGLGSGDRIINILLTSIVPSLTSLHTIPMFIWAIVTLGIIFHIFGFASLLFTFAGDSRCGKSEHDICSWACIISYILCATLTISIILTTINQYLVLMLIINVVLLMILPYFTSFIVIVSLYINIRKNIAEIQKLLKET